MRIDKISEFMAKTHFFDDLLSHQEDIQNRCFHPNNGFVEFRPEEIEQSIPNRFEAQVRKYPNRVAVKTDYHTYTYSELNLAANRIARAILTQQGHGEESVLLLFNHDSAMIAAIMGSLKAGKIYTALDPAYPVARITYILKDSHANLIVTNTKNLGLAQKLAGNQPHVNVLNVDKIDSGIATDNLALTLLPERIAYIIYTSGSTGAPKGVFQNHRNLLHNIMQYTNTLHLCRYDRLTLLYSCSVNGSLRDIFGALLNGALVYPYDVKVKGLTNLADWLIKEKITLYHSVPTLFRYFAETLKGDELFSDVRLVRFGGERVPKENVDLYKKYFPHHCILYCGMGTTETSTTRQLFIDKNTNIAKSIVPTGFAVAEREVLLLDETGQEVNVGEVGQVAIKSRYLALGYWGKPDLTREKFKPDPTNGNMFIYHTDDMGRLSPNTCLVHLGRQDFQANIRGYRIEITEIEVALMEHQAVKEAVIVIHEDKTGQQLLVAYIVPQPKHSPTPYELNQALKEKSPGYMFPSAFIMLDKIPLTPNGKINYRALPKHTPHHLAQEDNFVAPRDDLEHRLVNIWEDILEIQPIGVRDNFFEWGGHSLLGMQMVAQIETVIGKRISLTVLFHNSTIEKLAKVLHQEGWSPPFSSLLTLKTSGSKTPFFCLPGNLGNVFTDLGYLTHHLDPERPLHSFQDSIDNYIKIETVATHYIKEMQSIQPHGPYALGGICWGGAVVYEMAQQLLAAGETVSFLVLIEPSRPWKYGIKSYLNFFITISRQLFKRFLHHTQITTQLQSGRREAYLRLKLKVILNDWATRRYRPKPYPGQLHLIMGRESLKDPHNQRVDWQHWALEKTTLLEIPGNHNTVVDTNNINHHQKSMSVLGKLLRNLLDEALDNDNLK